MLKATVFCSCGHSQLSHGYLCISNERGDNLYEAVEGEAQPIGGSQVTKHADSPVPTSRTALRKVKNHNLGNLIWYHHAHTV